MVRVGCPAEALLDAGGVEDEAFGDHLVVIGAEGRDAEFVGEFMAAMVGPSGSERTRALAARESGCGAGGAMTDS